MYGGGTLLPRESACAARVGRAREAFYWTYSGKPRVKPSPVVSKLGHTSRFSYFMFPRQAHTRGCESDILFLGYGIFTKKNSWRSLVFCLDRFGDFSDGIKRAITSVIIPLSAKRVKVLVHRR